MRYLFNIFILVPFLFNGCSLKDNIVKKEPAVILIKSKKLKFYDTGFISYELDSFNIELFNSSNAILKLRVYNDSICKDNLCQDFKSFNKKYFNNYSFNLLYYLFNRKPILNRVGYIKIENGFKQIIKNSNYDIEYIIDSKKIYFYDKKSKIKIQKTNYNF